MLSGKTALVTDSTSGIGLGVARALAEAGCDVALNGPGDADLIESLRNDIENDFGVRCLFAAADVQRPAEIERMVQTVEEKLGPIDILVNNAGIQHTAPVDEFPVDRWTSVIATNLTADFLTIRAVLPQMRDRDWGRIINIASAHGLVGSPEKAAYVAAKHGVLGLTKVVALETATTGVTCNAICPGWVLTPLVENQVRARAAMQNISLAQARTELLTEKQPSGVFATPEQVGAFVVFLCSEPAAQIRGAALTMDGGWTAQ